MKEKTNLECDDMMQGSQSRILACMPASWHTVTNKKNILCNDSSRSFHRCMSYFKVLGWLKAFHIFLDEKHIRRVSVCFRPNVSLLHRGIVITVGPLLFLRWVSCFLGNWLRAFFNTFFNTYFTLYFSSSRTTTRGIKICLNEFWQAPVYTI